MTKTLKIKVKIKLLGKFYQSEGKTIEEALDNLEIPIAKGIGILTVSKGDKVREKVLRGNIINQFFGQRSPAMKTIALKNIITLFEDFK